jgi:hypothetical protein
MLHYPAINFASIAGDEGLTTGYGIGCIPGFPESGVVEIDDECSSVLVGKQRENYSVGMPAEIVVFKRLIEVFNYFCFRGIIDGPFKVDLPRREIEFG